MRWGSEVFQTLKGQLKKAGLNTNVGDEGGFAPNLPSAEAALDYCVKAIEAAGFKPGQDIAHRARPAPRASSSRTAPMSIPARARPARSSSRSTYLAKLVDAYPIVSIEDGLAEDDWQGWKLATDTLGKRLQLVGDDLFVTNVERLGRGIKEGVANSILIKVNQIGTLTETLAAVDMAHRAGYTAVMSHRSGETEDFDHRRPRGGDQLRPDQDRLALAARTGSPSTTSSSASRKSSATRPATPAARRSRRAEVERARRRRQPEINRAAAILAPMAVKTRARAILIPIVFYLVLGSASAWLVWGASQGERGLNGQGAIRRRVCATAEPSSPSFSADHARWRRRVESMRSEAVDRDLLDEEARKMLDRVGKDDVVIFVPRPRRTEIWPGQSPAGAGATSRFGVRVFSKG